jgi:hypothetical protein
MYYLTGDTLINNYVKLKCKKLYIEKEKLVNRIQVRNITELDTIDYTILPPSTYIELRNQNCYCIDDLDVFNSISNINEIFYFTEEVQNYALAFTRNIDNYRSVHLRLGDKFLETDKSFVFCKEDTRSFDESKMLQYILEHSDTPLFLFCDNNSYKQHIKQQFDFINITELEIGHTSFTNTTEQQFLYTCVEFYILLNSTSIYSASKSSFSMAASKFKSIPLLNNQYI